MTMKRVCDWRYNANLLHPLLLILKLIICICSRLDNAKAVHYNDVIMSTIASHITSVSIVYLIVCSDPDQGKHQSSASLAFVRGMHQWPVNSRHKRPVTRKMCPFGDVIMAFLEASASGGCSVCCIIVNNSLQHIVSLHLKWEIWSKNADVNMASKMDLI